MNEPTVAVITPTLDIELHEERIRGAVMRGGVPGAKLFMRQDSVPLQRYTRTVNDGIARAFELGTVTAGVFNCYEKSQPWDYVCLLNDDCEPQTDNWLAKLLWCFDLDNTRFPERGPIGYVAPGQPCRTVGMMEATGPADEPQTRHIFAVPFGCVVIKRAVFYDVGLLDPMFVHYSSDTDHQYRARGFGWQSVWAPHVWVDRKRHEPMMELWTADRRAFERRWGR